MSERTEHTVVAGISGMFIAMNAGLAVGIGEWHSAFGWCLSGWWAFHFYRLECVVRGHINGMRAQ